MINFESIKNKFPCTEFVDWKIRTNENDIVNLLTFLKDNSEFSFDILTSIIAVDLNDKIELIYQLYSTSLNITSQVSMYAFNSRAKSVVDVYKSAYFDECEIYDLFGVYFDGNPNLKRLLLPENWSGHPLLKSYEMKDERLVWND